MITTSSKQNKKVLIHLVVVIALFLFSFTIYYSILNKDLYIADDFSAFSPGAFEKYSNPDLVLHCLKRMIVERKLQPELEVTPGTFRPLFNLPIAYLNKLADGNLVCLRWFEFVLAGLSVLSIYGLLLFLFEGDVVLSCVGALLYSVSGPMAYLFTWMICASYNFNIIFFVIAFIAQCKNGESGRYVVKSFWGVLSVFAFLMMMSFSETGVILPFLVFAYLMIIKGKTIWRALIQSSFLLFSVCMYFFIRIVYLKAPIVEVAGQYNRQAGFMLFGSVGKYLQYFSRVLEHIIEVFIPWSYITSIVSVGILVMLWFGFVYFLVKDRKTSKQWISFSVIWLGVASLPLFAMATVRVSFFPTLAGIFMIVLAIRNYREENKVNRWLIIVFVIVYSIVQLTGVIQVIKVMSSTDTNNPLTLADGSLRNNVITYTKHSLQFNTESFQVAEKIKKMSKDVSRNEQIAYSKELLIKTQSFISSEQKHYAESIKMPPIVIYPIDLKVMVLIPPTGNVGGYYVDATHYTWCEYLVLEKYNGLKIRSLSEYVKPREANIKIGNHIELFQPCIGFLYSDILTLCKLMDKHLLTEEQYMQLAQVTPIFGDFYHETQGKYTSEIRPVALRKPNKYGVYGVFGNVWQVVMKNDQSHFLKLYGGSAFSSPPNGRIPFMKSPEKSVGIFGFRTTCTIRHMREVLGAKYEN